MNATGSEVTTPRRRRSPRLNEIIAVKIAGKAADGSVFAERASTIEISRFGARLLTTTDFAPGAPVALRRPGAAAMRARVVWCQPAAEPGEFHVGIEFVGGQDYWDAVFAPGEADAADDPHPSELHDEAPGEAAAGPPAQAPAFTAKQRAPDGHVLPEPAPQAASETESVIEIPAARGPEIVAPLAETAGLEASATEEVVLEIPGLSESVSQEANPMEQAPVVVPDAKAALAITAAVAQATAQAVRAAETAAEEVLRKAEAIRSQAERIVSDFAADLEAARKRNATQVATQSETLTELQQALSEELRTQANGAGHAVASAAETAQSGIASRLADAEQKLRRVMTEWQAVVDEGIEKWSRAAAESEQRSTQLTSAAAVLVEQQRRALADLDTQAAARREQLVAFNQQQADELKQRMEAVRAELNAAASAVVTDFRQTQLPAAAQELSALVAGAMAEQKGALAQWMAQTLESFRTSAGQAESACRASLREQARVAAEQYAATVAQKQEQEREQTEAIAAGVQARLEAARAASDALAAENSRSLAATRDEWARTRAESEAQFREVTAGRIADIADAARQASEQLQSQNENIQGGILEASRQLDHSARQLRQMAEDLELASKDKRGEIDSLFASLMGRYDTRREALDRLFEAIENTRMAVRTDVDLLRTATEENLARVARAAGERESAIKARAIELEQQLTNACISLEATLQERVTAALGQFEDGFRGAVERISEQGRQTFSARASDELLKAGARLDELVRSLKQSTEQLRDSLRAGADEHIHRFGAMSEELRQQAGAGREAVERAVATAQQSVDQRATQAIASVEQRHHDASVSLAETIARTEEARNTLTGSVTELERRIQERRQELDGHASSLFHSVEQKQNDLTAFLGRMDAAATGLQKTAAGFEQKVQEAQAAIHALGREFEASLENRSAALIAELRDSLGKTAHNLQQEMLATGEANHGVFEARVRSAAEQATAAAKKSIEQYTDLCAVQLDSNLQRAREEAEKRSLQFNAQVDQQMREHLQRLQEFPLATMGRVNEQIQQNTRTAIDRVREAHDVLLRDIPQSTANAERAFRERLDAIIAQTRTQATEAIAAASAQLTQQAELELRHKLYGVQAQEATAGSPGE